MRGMGGVTWVGDDRGRRWREWIWGGCRIPFQQWPFAHIFTFNFYLPTENCGQPSSDDVHPSSLYPAYLLPPATRCLRNISQVLSFLSGTAHRTPPILLDLKNMRSTRDVSIQISSISNSLCTVTNASYTATPLLVHFVSTNLASSCIGLIFAGSR